MRGLLCGDALAVVAEVSPDQTFHCTEKIDNYILIILNWALECQTLSDSYNRNKG